MTARFNPLFVWSLGLAVAVAVGCDDGAVAGRDPAASNGTTATAGATGAAGASGGSGVTAGASTGVGLTGGAVTGGTGLSGATATTGVLSPEGGVTGGEGGVGTNGGSTAGSGGHFPRSDEAVDVEVAGPYAVASYEEEALDDAEYLDPIIFYPTDASPPFATVAFSMGFTETREQLYWIAESLASHGFVSFVVTPTATASLLHGPAVRADDLVKMRDVLAAENERAGGPLEGMLDMDRMGLSGHSMGGGASLFAGATMGSKVRAIVPLQSYEPGGNFSSITAPTLILAAQADAIAAVASNARPHYDSLTATKVFAEVAGAGHMIGTGGVGGGSEAEHTLQARYIISWMKMHLEDDDRYKTYVYGAEHDKVAGSLSSFETAN